MSKGWKITLIVIASLFAFIFLFLGIYFLWPWNAKFFDIATKEFNIPGLDSTFVPQGFADIGDANTFIISGYMSDGSASRLYVVDADSFDNYFVTLLDDTNDYLGHAGGVAVCEDKVWVVSGDDGGHCYTINLNNILSAQCGDKIGIDSKFATNNGADFVFVYDSLLWVGEFHKDGAYDTDSSHHITTTSGEINKALVFAYTIDTTTNSGVYNYIPVKALSIRSLCQGIAMTNDGKFVMSTSYSLPDSNIYYYNSVLLNDADTTITINDNTIPLWFLDNNSLTASVNAPSMSEELVVKGDKVYILFESACKKYRLFNRKRLTNVYSLPLNFFEK